MKKTTKAKLIGALIAASLMGMTGCFFDSDRGNVSTDTDALRKLVTLPFPYTDAKWEIVDTPEGDFPPGPTDYQTLIAEVTPGMDTSATQKERGRPFAIIPNAAREWLHPEFNALLKKHVLERFHTDSDPRCAPVRAVVNPTAKHVDGFVCDIDKRRFVYMMIEDFTGHDQFADPATASRGQDSAPKLPGSPSPGHTPFALKDTHV